jgi:uncharacterized membrane protein
MRHPLVRAAIAIPLGLLAVSPMFDVLLFLTHSHVWAWIGFVVLTVGTLGGLAAVLAALWELRRERPSTKPFRVTLFEVGALLTALLFYLTSWVIRLAVGVWRIGGGEFACSLLGSIVLLMGTWWGAPLVEKWKIGLSVDPAAEQAARHAERHEHQPDAT